jgi:hypothetical protein
VGPAVDPVAGAAIAATLNGLITNGPTQGSCRPPAVASVTVTAPALLLKSEIDCRLQSTAVLNTVPPVSAKFTGVPLVTCQVASFTPARAVTAVGVPEIVVMQLGVHSMTDPLELIT